MWGQTQIDLGLPHQKAELFAAHAVRGLVVFVHGDGGHQTSWRSRELAHTLQRRGLSALLFDLLSQQESQDKEAVYDIPRLVQRLSIVLDSLPGNLRGLPLGLFGTDTGAAAAVATAVQGPCDVQALVCCSGWPELAGAALGALRAPTLLIVGAADADAVAHNRRAYLHMRCQKRIEIVPRATHLFLEAGAMDAVARLAGDWFVGRLASPDE